jgi:hypothetical protein
LDTGEPFVFCFVCFLFCLFFVLFVFCFVCFLFLVFWEVFEFERVFLFVGCLFFCLFQSPCNTPATQKQKPKPKKQHRPQKNAARAHNARAQRAHTTRTLVRRVGAVQLGEPRARAQRGVVDRLKDLGVQGRRLGRVERQAEQQEGVGEALHADADRAVAQVGAARRLDWVVVDVDDLTHTTPFVAVVAQSSSSVVCVVVWFLWLFLCVG